MHFSSILKRLLTIFLFIFCTQVPLFASADYSATKSAEIQIESYIEAKFGKKLKVYFFDRVEEAKKQQISSAFQRIVDNAHYPIDFGIISNINFHISSDGSSTHSEMGTPSVTLDIESDPASWLIALSKEPAKEDQFVSYIKYATSSQAISLRKLVPQIVDIHETAEKFLCGQSDLRSLNYETLEKYVHELSSFRLDRIEKKYSRSASKKDLELEIKALFKGQGSYIVNFSISYGSNPNFANRYNRFTYASFEIFKIINSDKQISIASTTFSGRDCKGRDIHWNIFEQGKSVKRVRAQSPSWKIDAELVLNPPPAQALSYTPALAQRPLIAIIDSGVDYNHEKLRSLYRINMDRSNSKYADKIRPDKLEKYRESFGWDFKDDDELPYPYAESLSLRDFIHHGTHVSGIASGDYFPLLPIRYESGPRMLDAIKYAVFKGAKIINMSLGSYDYDEWKYVQQAIRIYREVLFVTAAGNESSDIDQKPSYPAAFQEPNLITVAAVNPNGQLADFSNWGLKRVHVATEGVDVESYKVGGGTVKHSGTSMAAPYISYRAAQILERRSNLNPEEIIIEIMNLCTATPNLKTKVLCGGWIPKK